MKTFFYTISFLALLASPASCVMEKMNYNNQETNSLEGGSYESNSTESPIDPPIMPTKPQ